MSEKHPIDELFHHVLHHAEVPPPPEVWEGIVRTRRSRRRTWWPWAIAATLLLSTGGAWWMMDGRDAASATVAQPEEGTRKAPMSSHQAIAEAPAPEAPVRSANGPMTTDASERSEALQEASGLSNAHDGPAPPTSPSTRPLTEPTRSRTTTNPVERSTPREDLTPPTPAKDMPKDPGSRPARFELLAPDLARTQVPGQELRRNLPPAYVLPKVEQWLALEFGTYDVDRTWSGGDEELVDALNATDVPHPTWSAGALFGWTWRNGFGVSAGAAYEGSRYDYQHLDRALAVDSIVQTPYFVTLDTQVFVSSTITTVYGTSEDMVVNGSNSLGLVHVPVEAYWHTSLRRWSVGARAGLVGEFTVSRRGYTLVNTDDDGIRSVPNDSPLFNSRYAPVISGTLGADLGYLLTERWGLWASPSYMHGIAALGTTDQPWALPQRFSLRMRLSYSLSRTH